MPHSGEIVASVPICFDLRMRRLKVALSASVEWQGMQALLNPIKDVGYIGSEDLADRWRARVPDSVEGCAHSLLHGARPSSTRRRKPCHSQRRQVRTGRRMIINAEVRRNAGLREIERHRDSFGAALRQASDDVVEAEFLETSPVQGMQQDAA